MWDGTERWSGRGVGSRVVGQGSGELTGESDRALIQLALPEDSGWVWVPDEEFYLDRVGDWTDPPGQVDSGTFYSLWLLSSVVYDA